SIAPSHDVIPKNLCSKAPYHQRDLHSFPTRRSSDLPAVSRANFDVVETLAHSFPGGRYALGIHPIAVPHAQEEDLARLAERAERSEEHTSELQSREKLVCRLLLEKKNTTNVKNNSNT